MTMAELSQALFAPGMVGVYTLSMVAYLWAMAQRVDRADAERRAKGRRVLAVTEECAIGDVLTIIPNHACAVSNLHDVVHGVAGGRVERSYRVAARGRVA